MGKVDQRLKDYFGNPRYFADLFNGCLFGGEHVLDADSLEDYKTVETLGYI